MFGAADAERTVVTGGVATFWSADGLVRVFAGWRQKNHAPARHNRHNKIQMNGRERITIGQMIISHNFRQSEDGLGSAPVPGAVRRAPAPNSETHGQTIRGAIGEGADGYSRGGCAPHPQSSILVAP